MVHICVGLLICLVATKTKGHSGNFVVVDKCQVMREPSGISRGSGFVAFSTSEEASRAVSFCLCICVLLFALGVLMAI